MKKIITLVLCAAMLASMICMLPVSVSAGDNYVLPELIITEIECNPKGTDFYEYIEIVNTTKSDIDLYEYVIGYCGEQSTHEQYEKAIVETTPIKKDWYDKGAKSYDKTTGELVYNDYTMEGVTNPESGVIAPGEAAVLWFICGDCYNPDKNPPNPMDFRGKWNVPESVKVFAIDANGSSSDRNFNLKNSKTGTYVIMKYNEQINTMTNTVPQVKEDILNGATVVVPANSASTIYYTANGYMDDQLIVSWATLDFVGTNSPCYKVCQAAGVIDGDGVKSQDNAIHFLYDETNVKRAVPATYGGNTPGVLSEDQKTLIATYGAPEAPATPDVTTTTPVGDVTTTVPAGDSTTVPAGDVTTTAPAGDDTTTVAIPADTTTEAPADDTTTAPADDVTTTAIPNDTTTKAPDTTKEPAKKGCGGFALAAQLVAILGAAVTVVIVKKK